LRQGKDVEVLQQLFDKFIEKQNIIEKAGDDIPNAVMHCNYMAKMTNILRILNGVLLKVCKNNALLGDGSEPSQLEEYAKCVTFAIAWGIGGLYGKDEREIFHQYLSEKGFPLPRKGRENETVFDYYLRPNAKNCLEWALCVPEDWQPPRGEFRFSRVILPTADTLRA
jgi:hypothetical protein